MRPLLKTAIILLGLPVALLFAGVSHWFMTYIVGMFAVEALAIIVSISVFVACVYTGYRLFNRIDGVDIKVMEPSSAHAPVLETRTKDRTLGASGLTESTPVKDVEQNREQYDVDKLLAEVNKGKKNTPFDMEAMYQDEYGSAWNVNEAEDYTLPEELQARVDNKKPSNRGLPRF